jgi:molecular chaperone GrpE
MTDDQPNPTDIDLTESPSPPAGNDSEAPEAILPEKTAKEPAPPTPEERIAADFDNWKKRSRKELADSEARTRENVLRDFLEVIDNLERAAGAFADGKETDAKAVREGVELVLRQFRSKLERYQVKPVESTGQPFDPRLHEAISQMPSADAKPGSIVHEFQRGYLIGDKLLRPAMVVVATAPPPPPEASPAGVDDLDPELARLLAEVEALSDGEVDRELTDLTDNHFEDRPAV